MASVLLIERDKLQRWAVTQILESVGHEVHGGDTLADASAYLDNFQPAALLIDRALPDGLAFDFIRQHRVELTDTAIVLMTAVEQVSEAADALRLQLAGYLRKPIDDTELLTTLDRSLDHQREHREAEAARRGLQLEMERSLVAESQTFRQILHTLHDLANSEVRCLLIRGARCTGKKALASYLHAVSSRRGRPLLSLRCHVKGRRPFDETLFGIEMAGTEDTRTRIRGLLELADGGTLVFDEIARLPIQDQARLRHVIETGHLRRTGSDRKIPTDVRIVAITDLDLAPLAQQGRFDKALLRHLEAATVSLPPLQEHPEDILPLARHFLETLAPRFDNEFTGFSAEAENALLTYSWPGNVCELRHVVERAMIMGSEPLIGAQMLRLGPPGGPLSADDQPPSATRSTPDIRTLEEAERELVVQAMQATAGHRTRAAGLLGISRDQLRYRLRKFGLDS